MRHDEGVFDPAEHIRNHAERFVPDSKVAFVGGTYIKQFDLPKGMAILSHKHAYDHASILASGKARIRINGAWHEREAPAVVSIAAGEEHLIVAIDDAVWFCIHAVDQASEAYRSQDPHSMDGLLIVRKAE